MMVLRLVQEKTRRGKSSMGITYLNRHERRKREKFARKSTQKKGTRGAFGLTVFYPSLDENETNHQRHLRLRKEKRDK